LPNILHITNWYPSKPTPFSARWIYRHIASLSGHTENIIYHLEIRKGRFKIHRGRNDNSSVYQIIYLPFTIWRLNEIISFLMIIGVLFATKNQKIDLVNFHIAYPNCSYISILKKLFNYKLIITEHWSAYHYNFNISNPQKKKRIQRIFQNDIPVITVSNALMRDIKNFSLATYKGYVVPNIVDTNIFKYTKKKPSTEPMKFFMVSQWKWPKNPFAVIKAWEKVITIFPEATLRIGGYGPQINEMEKLIDKLDLNKKVIFIGELTPHQVAWEMQNAKAFVHCSEYETFSVACAEALCCGTPVIASRVGGIPEYIHSENGILVEDNSSEAFSGRIIDMLSNNKDLDFKKIAKDASNRFSERKIGRQYLSVLNDIITN
jgi:glycosyltransferase involved in cell wall biosynthesis